MSRKQRLPRVRPVLFQKRDDILRREGFLNWERYWLCQHSITSAGARAMRRDRLQFLDAFGITFESLNEYRREIGRTYRERGWTFLDGRLNPFAMLDEYKKKQNIPDTPQPKRRAPRKTGTYKSKVAKSIAKIPGHLEYQKEHRLK